MKCTHYLCRCARAAELAAMADRADRHQTGQGARLLAEAVAAHGQEVECRVTCDLCGKRGAIDVVEPAKGRLCEECIGDVKAKRLETDTKRSQIIMSATDHRYQPPGRMTHD